MPVGEDEFRKKVRQALENMKKPGERKARPPRKPVYITPYLPKIGEQDARLWRAAGRGPAFVMAFDHEYKRLCNNCNGTRVVVLRLCGGGPYMSPNSPKQIVTWFDGDDMYRAGFYEVQETKVYTCPYCNGEGVRSE